MCTLPALHGVNVGSKTGNYIGIGMYTSGVCKVNGVHEKAHYAYRAIRVYKQVRTHNAVAQCNNSIGVGVYNAVNTAIVIAVKPLAYCRGYIGVYQVPVAVDLYDVQA